MPPPFNLNETSPAANALISSYPSDERSFRATCEEWLSFISDPATGLIRESVLPATTGPIASGSKSVFHQTAAPSGWTKDVTHNNKAMRVVSGSVVGGGSVAFTTAFASKTPVGTLSTTAITATIGATAITLAQMPSHTHAFTTDSAGSHTHTYLNLGNTVQVASGGGTGRSSASQSTQAAGAHSHSGTTDASGSGTTHTHTFTGTAHGHTFTGTAINLAVQYVDLILATKD